MGLGLHLPTGLAAHPPSSQAWALARNAIRKQSGGRVQCDAGELCSKVALCRAVHSSSGRQLQGLRVWWAQVLKQRAGLHERAQRFWFMAGLWDGFRELIATCLGKPSLKSAGPTHSSAEEGGTGTEPQLGTSQGRNRQFAVLSNQV
jgi:hypothetical protein